MTKLTLAQKRLEVLRNQLYGKPHTKVKPKEVVSFPRETKQTKDTYFRRKELAHIYAPTKKEMVSRDDQTSDFIRSDLIKIFLFASGAIIAQILLYFASIKGIINLSSLASLRI